MDGGKGLPLQAKVVRDTCDQGACSQKDMQGVVSNVVLANEAQEYLVHCSGGLNGRFIACFPAGSLQFLLEYTGGAVQEKERILTAGYTAEKGGKIRKMRT